MATTMQFWGNAPQADLYGSTGLSGLRSRNEFLAPDEERELITRIDECGLSPFRFQQWEGKRLTRSFGWNYDFTNGSFARTEPIPDWLRPIRDRAAIYAGLETEALEQALLIRYDVGAGIGWHRDRPVFEHVVGLSLGSPATMRFRRRRDAGFQRAKAVLEPRGIYHLAGEARHEWEHSIAAMDVPRWSITFRSRTKGSSAFDIEEG